MAEIRRNVKLIYYIAFIFICICGNSFARDVGVFGGYQIGLAQANFKQIPQQAVQLPVTHNEREYLFAFEISLGMYYKQISLIWGYESLGMLGPEYKDPKEEEEPNGQIPIKNKIGLSSILGSLEILNSQKIAINGLIGYVYADQSTTQLYNQKSLFNNYDSGLSLGFETFIFIVGNNRGNPKDFKFLDNVFIGARYENVATDRPLESISIMLGSGIMNIAYGGLNLNYINHKKLHETYYITFSAQIYTLSMFQ
ncbi:MAG: hypothetical protein GY839_19755 [candidate division Zixibacteria bacterium]|nr:hypothetical protein [candidate division Zixibacteria bacterium]